MTALYPGPVETEFFDVSGPTPIENVVPRPAWVDVVPGRAMQAIVAAGRITPQEIRGPLFGRFFR